MLIDDDVFSCEGCGIGREGDLNSSCFRLCREGELGGGNLREGFLIVKLAADLIRSAGDQTVVGDAVDDGNFICTSNVLRSILRI